MGRGLCDAAQKGGLSLTTADLWFGCAVALILLYSLILYAH